MFLIYVSDKTQVVTCDLLYTKASYLGCQHKDVKIKYQLNEDFCNICEWLVDNKLSVGKTKSMLCASKFRKKNKKRNMYRYRN